MLAAFRRQLEQARLADGYEAAHARLALETAETVLQRRALARSGQIKALPSPSREAAEKSYVEAALRLATGLEAKLDSYQDAIDHRKRAVFEAWSRCRQLKQP